MVGEAGIEPATPSNADANTVIRRGVVIEDRATLGRLLAKTKAKTAQ